MKYFTQWIQGHFDHTFLPAPPEPPDRGMKRTYDFTPRHGRWIFALLTQLDSQLTSDEISILRNLVREVCKLIKEERLDREDRFSTRSQVRKMPPLHTHEILYTNTAFFSFRTWVKLGVG